MSNAIFRTVLAELQVLEVLVFLWKKCEVNITLKGYAGNPV